MAKATSQEQLAKGTAKVQEVAERLESNDVRPRTCDQARLAIGKLEYVSPVDVLSIKELAEIMDDDALLAALRDHLNILLRRRLPKTISATDAHEALSNPAVVLTALAAYRYNARSGEVSQATKDKRLGEATRKLMTQFGVDSEDELVAILKERMAEANA